MKCTLNPNIQNLSGKAGKLMFKTFTKRDGTTETRVYALPRRKDGSYGYERRTPVSKAEQDNRSTFAVAQSIKAKLTDEQKTTLRHEFSLSKGMYRGKKYRTLQGFISAWVFAFVKEQKQGDSGPMAD